METQRNFLVIALLVVTYLLFTNWQAENAPVIQQPQAIINNESSSDDFVPSASSDNVLALSELETKAATAKIITVETDVLSVKINSQGGDVVEVKLLDYFTEQGSDIPLTIMQNGAQKYIAQSGLIGANGPDQLIKGRPIYQTSATSYKLNDGENSLTVSLQFVDNNGLTVNKNFTFERSSHAIKLDYVLVNNTTANASVQLYAQLKQSTYVDTSSTFIPTYRGAAYSTTEENYEKYDFSDIADANLNVTTKGGWVAMLQHYFVSAWVPNAEQNNQLYTNFTKNYDAVIGFKAPAITIPANSQTTTSTILYVGPKIQETLESIATHLHLTVDYGFLFMISEPLFWLLTAIQSVVINWGIAIIIITIIVKTLMYPLTKTQYTSMAKMRDLQPKIAQLKERFGGDRQKMSQGMMELYRKEKVNPAGGCLPMIIQMPIFLALYWVFLESVELRHASFGLWITDLSSPDPYYILPILMGASMYIMQKMQPVTMQDPMQQKVMQYMPVVFSVFFFFFASGLVLYWFVSNVISIIQMKIIFSAMEKNKNKDKDKK